MSTKTAPIKIPADALEIAKEEAKKDERSIGTWVARAIREKATGSPEPKPEPSKPEK